MASLKVAPLPALEICWAIEERMPIGKLIASPQNPRNFLADDSKDRTIVELSKSIGVDGIVSPIVARPHPTAPGCFEIRAGERRFRAARLAGLEFVRCQYREMDDLTAMRATLIENMERENLTPLEEANGIATAVSVGMTLDQIAAETGRSISVIKRRAQLTKLAKQWREASANDSHPVSSWPVSHLESIARFPEGAQIAILREFEDRHDEEYLRGMTLVTLRGELAEFLHVINLAAWDKNDAALVPRAGACVGCPKRSDCADQADLFDSNEFEDFRGKKKGVAGARCLDVTCWTMKSDAHLKQVEAKLKQEHGSVTIVAESSYGLPKESPYKKRAVRKWDVEIGAKTHPAAKPGLMVDGPRIGEVVWIVPAGTKSGGARNKSSNGKAAAPGERKPIAERRAALELVRGRMLVQELANRIEKICGLYPIGEKKPDFLAFDNATSHVLHESMLRFAAVFGTETDPPTPIILPPKTEFDDRWAVMAEMERQRFFVEQFLFFCALEVLVSTLRSQVSSSQYSKKIDLHDATCACDFLKIDYAGLRAEIEVLKPEPKSWAREESDAKAAKQQRANLEKVKTPVLRADRASEGKGGKVTKKGTATAAVTVPKVTPGVCASCGCSEDDPCVDEKTFESCGWANGKRTCCTFCTDLGNGRVISRPNRVVKAAPVVPAAGKTKAKTGKSKTGTNAKNEKKGKPVRRGVGSVKHRNR